MTGIIVPESVEYIINVLYENGFKAYAVGGCVRDALLGVKPSDWDIATDARPGQVKALFGKTVDTGIRHGTVTVFAREEMVEVTTFRSEGRYSDHRHPDTVSFTCSLEEDLQRRDFTVNAMAYHPRRGLVDHTGGIRDLRDRILRAVGNPDERFREDALRMLRAVRFSAQLGFEIEDGTFKAIRNNSSLIKNISAERIRDEIDRILLSSQPVKFIAVSESGLLEYIIPELQAVYDSLGSAEKVKELLLPLEHEKRSRITGWSILLSRIEKPENVLRRLRFDKRSMKMISRVVKNLGIDVAPDRLSVRRAVFRTGKEVFEKLLDVWEAADESGSLLYDDAADRTGLRTVYMDIIEGGQPVSLADLAIDGHDIVRLGCSGKKVGKVLNHLMGAVIENPELNSRDMLITTAKNFIFKRQV